MFYPHLLSALSTNAPLPLLASGNYLQSPQYQGLANMLLSL
jgi:hypothetical protein